jgi:hypothetical protein
MARQHAISPNQTVLWAYQALASIWGSPALREAPETYDSPRGTAMQSRRTAGGRTRTKIKARPSTGRQTSSRVRTQQDTTRKNEQVRTGAEGNGSRPPRPGRKKIFFIASSR